MVAAQRAVRPYIRSSSPLLPVSRSFTTTPLSATDPMPMQCPSPYRHHSPRGRKSEQRAFRSAAGAEEAGVRATWQGPLGQGVMPPLPPRRHWVCLLCPLRCGARQPGVRQCNNRRRGKRVTIHPHPPPSSFGHDLSPPHPNPTHHRFNGGPWGPGDERTTVDLRRTPRAPSRLPCPGVHTRADSSPTAAPPSSPPAGTARTTHLSHLCWYSLLQWCICCTDAHCLRCSTYITLRVVPLGGCTTHMILGWLAAYSERDSWQMSRLQWIACLHIKPVWAAWADWFFGSRMHQLFALRERKGGLRENVQRQNKTTNLFPSSGNSYINLPIVFLQVLFQFKF
jgi:hypothetical protein